MIIISDHYLNIRQIYLVEVSWLLLHRRVFHIFVQSKPMNINIQQHYYWCNILHHSNMDLENTLYLSKRNQKPIFFVNDC
jgi:hypothetical protein